MIDKVTPDAVIDKGDTIPINLVSQKDVEQTPWGRGNKLFEKKISKSKEGSAGSVSANGTMTLYCVDCGVTGSITYSSHFRWNIGHVLAFIFRHPAADRVLSPCSAGVKEAALNVDGRAHAGIGVGLIAEFELNAETGDKLLATVGLPGLSLGSLGTIGPAGVSSLIPFSHPAIPC